ncbi:tRNA (adenosine(37)-N6)-threonylcarbamoyltransferase complex ATPase subunit type 1 TsaE, partial [Flavobacterium sp.]
MEILFSLDEITQVAQKILRENPAKVMVFNGPMGAGKTTLIKV